MKCQADGVTHAIRTRMPVLASPARVRGRVSRRARHGIALNVSLGGFGSARPNESTARTLNRTDCVERGIWNGIVAPDRHGFHGPEVDRVRERAHWKCAFSSSAVNVNAAWRPFPEGDSSGPRYERLSLVRGGVVSTLKSYEATPAPPSSSPVPSTRRVNTLKLASRV